MVVLAELLTKKGGTTESQKPPRKEKKNERSVAKIEKVLRTAQKKEERQRRDCA